MRMTWDSVCTVIIYLELRNLTTCTNRALNTFPGPSTTHPPYKIDQPDQHGYLDERPDRSSKCLVAVRTIRGNGHSDCELEVVACSCEALGCPQFVSISELVAYEQREEEDDNEVHNEWCGDSNDGDDLVDHLATLRGEENEDGIEKADE